MGRDVRPGRGVWEEQPLARLPIPGPSPHTDTRTLVVGSAVVLTAHLLGFDRSLQARDSVSKDAARGLPRPHIIKPHLEMV